MTIATADRIARTPVTVPARRCAALVLVAPGAVLVVDPEAVLPSFTLFVHVMLEGIWKLLESVTSVHYSIVY